jgi:hypothetical protein
MQDAKRESAEHLSLTAQAAQGSAKDINNLIKKLQR